MNGLKNMSVRFKLLLLTVPLMVCIVIAVVFAALKINQTQDHVTELYYDTLYQVNSNLINADRDYYQSLIAATQYYEMNNGFTDMPAQLLPPYLIQKHKDYEENRQQVLDNVNAAVEIAKTNDSLYKETISENGKSFEEAVDTFYKDMAAWDASFNLKENSGSWTDFNNDFQITRAILNDMQEITETWAHEENAILAKENTATIVGFAIVFALIIVVLLVFTFIIVQEIIGGIKRVTGELDELANGNLTLTFPEDQAIGADEIGMIQRSTKHLTEKLRDIIEKTKQMSQELTNSGRDLSDSASQASQASGQVTDAVTEISKGAVAQAESVETAAGDTDEMGNNIENIASNVREMDQCATDMKQSCDKAMVALDGLMRHSEEVTRSVKDVGNTIAATNDSVKIISEFTQAITDIATQTNLLSLNASIEAARAGDAGRGFAVVADEIRQLADQSSTSADKIKSIVERLLEDSAASVNVLKKLNESFEVQGEQLNSTKSEMEHMTANVSSVRETSSSISGRVSSLTDSKNGFTAVISDLSAISEENAASTQETNASMEELNATFTFISESAYKLRELATSLEETISYFTV